MVPVEQTKFGDDGNCYAACLASILECSLEEVPVWGGSQEPWIDYMERVQGFLHKRGLCAISVTPAHFSTECRLKFPGYAILSADSPRVDCWHAVVWHEGAVAWDPHPQREMGVGDPHEMTFLVCLHPEQPNHGILLGRTGR